MSPRRAAASGSSGGGRAAITALILIGVAVGMLLLVRSGPDIPPYDPRSSADNGANAAVLLLERFGATVDISARAPEVRANERVLVIADRLNSAQRGALLEFVDAGGVAVVADQSSTLHGGASVADGATAIDAQPVGDNRRDAINETNVPRGACSVVALERLRGVFAPDGQRFPVSPDTDHCFGDDDHAFVIVRHYGAGIVVGLGDINVVTNRFLRYADNAGLLTALLVPAAGANVRIMIGTEAKAAVSDIGSGDESLLDLVPQGVRMGLVQLAFAFVVLCVARGVRAGRAVREPAPIPIAGNELVVATGNLMQRARHEQRAGWLLRSEFHRQLLAHHRAEPGVSLDRLTRLVANRTGADQQELWWVLHRDVTSSAELMDLTDRLDRLRRVTLANAPTLQAPRTPEHV